MNSRKKTEYPEWVERYHTKGTAIKKIRDNYYLYKVTSRYLKEKTYPVSIQTYIGKIDEEKGLIRPSEISFSPGKDSLLLFKDIFPLDQYDVKERKLLENIPLICINKTCYTGKLDDRIIRLILKHYSYNEGIVS